MVLLSYFEDLVGSKMAKIMIRRRPFLTFHPGLTLKSGQVATEVLECAVYMGVPDKLSRTKDTKVANKYNSELKEQRCKKR